MSSEVTQSTGYYEFLAWLELNKKRVIAAVIIVALIALVVSFTVWRKNQSEIAANAALLKLGLPMQQGESSTPISSSDLLAVVNDYPGTATAARALLLAAGALFNENKYADALLHFQKYQTQYSSSPEAPLAALGIASCYESENKTDEALAAYQKVISSYPSDPVASQARLALGRLYELKKQPELALRSYEELTRQNMRSPWQAEAIEKREQLLLRNPQLAPTNPPVLPSLTKPVATNLLKPALISKTNAAAVPAVSRTNAPVPKPVGSK